MWLQNRLPYCKVYLQTAWTWLFFTLWGMQRTELFQCYEANTHGWCPRWWLNFDDNGRYSNEYLMKYTQILEVNLFPFAYRLFHEDFSPIYVAMRLWWNIVFFIIIWMAPLLLKSLCHHWFFWGSNFLQLESLPYNTWVRRLLFIKFRCFTTKR